MGEVSYEDAAEDVVDVLLTDIPRTDRLNDVFADTRYAFTQALQDIDQDYPSTIELAVDTREERQNIFGYRKDSEAGEQMNAVNTYLTQLQSIDEDAAEYVFARASTVLNELGYHDPDGMLSRLARDGLEAAGTRETNTGIATPEVSDERHREKFTLSRRDTVDKSETQKD